ncbi:MAG: GlcG/HbpS family heme-binding protein [Aeoliella sp.]
MAKKLHNNRCGPRKIVAPERLEPRNAPGAMMLAPLPSAGVEPDSVETVSFVETSSSEMETRLVVEETQKTPTQETDLAILLPVQEDETSEEETTESVEPPTSFQSVSVPPVSSISPAPPALPLVSDVSEANPNQETEEQQTETTSDAPPQQTSKSAASQSSGGGSVSYGAATGSDAPNDTTTSVNAPINQATTPPQFTQPVAESTSSEPAFLEAIAGQTNNVQSSSLTPQQAQHQILSTEVSDLLARASGATNSNDAIIAIVDRGGRILGVRVEDDVLTNIPDTSTMVFAIDGAVAKARTAAFFSNDDAALTSRTVRFISQTTITQREVQSNPNSSDQSIKGPGFVAPIGLGSHFPPDVRFTPQVDLVGIEHTNRDSVAHPGADRVKQATFVDSDGNITATSGDDIFLQSRFGADFDTGKEVFAPESFGVVSAMRPDAQGRGIATLPGGIPLYKNGVLAGGIGVFFPGTDGFADFEQGFEHGVGQTTKERTNAPKVLEAEFMALAVAANEEAIAGIDPVDGFGTSIGRIDLVGITLETVGPHRGGIGLVQSFGQSLSAGAVVSGNEIQVTQNNMFLDGLQVADGWLVSPKAGTNLTATEVQQMIERGIAEAELVRSAIRLPLGSRSRMVLGVTDTDGTVLGLFRMPDATVFSIDVAVAKARNVSYYADATELQAADQVVEPGTAFTNRTFRYLSTAFFPSGVGEPGPFSILNDPGVNPATAENLVDNQPADADDHQSVLGFDAFNPGSNFHEPVAASGFQNGVVFFPGSTPLYKNGQLVGGLGISGDGVDQDDVVTFSAAGDMLPRGANQPGVIRADQVFLDGVRLPYQKFNRNPRG